MAKIPQTRRCTCCGRDLPFTDFYFSRKRMVYATYCKECHNRKGREYYASMVNKEEICECRHFTADEIDYLQKNYRKKTARQIAAVLHRTARSVWRKAYELGLRKITSYRNKKKTSLNRTT